MFDKKQSQKAGAGSTQIQIGTMNVFLNDKSESDDKYRFHSDNAAFLEMYRKPLFLDEDNPDFTLEKLYVDPMIQENKELAESSITKWRNSSNHCMLLYGDAGIGKSSLVARLIDQACISENCTDDPSKASVQAVALRNHTEVFEALKDDYHINNVLRDLFSIEFLNKQPDRLLILDGFDELIVLIPDFTKRKAAEFIKKLCKVCATLDMHVLVTSRKGYYEIDKNQKGIKQYTLCWTSDQVDNWCGKYKTKGGDFEEWCLQFPQQYTSLPQNDPEDKRYEILCVPFILYLCCNSLVDLKKNITVCQIYDLAFRTILQREHSALKGTDAFVCLTDEQRQDVYWQFAKELAFQMFLLDTLDLTDVYAKDDKKFIGMQNAKKRTVDILREKKQYTINPKDIYPPEFLSVFSFAKSSGDKGITFVHKTVYEYFAAVKIYEDYFSFFDDSYFEEKTPSEASEEVVKNVIEAFRYHPITADISAYLSEMTKSSFLFNKNTDSHGLNYPALEDAFLCAIKSEFDSDLILHSPIQEYFYNSRHKAPISLGFSQLNCAFHNFTWFMTEHGFQNVDGDSVEWIGLGASTCPVNMKGWNLQKQELVNADFRWAHLENADLRNANLDTANMFGAFLAHANLTEACLENAMLEQADMTSANLIGANLVDSVLKYANLKDTVLDEADLDGAVLAMADMKKAKLRKTNLIDADLRDACLNGADLSGANLKGATLKDAVLEGACLIGADLNGADLRGTNLKGAILENAILVGSNLESSDLRSANLIDAKLTMSKLKNANLKDAVISKDTHFEGANMVGTDMNETRLIKKSLQSKIHDTSSSDKPEPC